MTIPVLVVDSNVDHGKTIKETLEASNLFQVILATRAIEALMRFTETRFRVAIIDFGLPDLNGEDLIRQIRGIDERSIVVAVLDNKEAKPADIDKLAINLILDKPTYLSELPQKLAQLLNLASSPSQPSPPPASKPIIETPPIQKEPVQKEAPLADPPQRKVPQVDSSKDVPSQEKTFQEKPVQDKVFQEDAKLHKGAQVESVKEAVSQEDTIQDTAVEEKVLQKEANLQEVPQAQGVQQSAASDEALSNEIAHGETRPEEELQPKTTRDEPEPVEDLQEETTTIPPWLKEPTQVEEYLASLEQEHSAFATLLSLGSTPWTYSKQLTENQAHGIVRLLSEHDEGLQSKGALIRYIRLSGGGNDYLLYATPVVGDINLTLIFTMDTPFSVARRQTHKLSRLLANQDPRKVLAIDPKPITEETISVSQEEDDLLAPSDWLPKPDPPVKTTKPPVQTPTPVIEEEPARDPVVVAAKTSAPDIPVIPDDWMPKHPRPSSHLPFLEQEADETEKIIELEPINLTQQEPKYYLPFTTILLPRFPNHRLTGSLGNQIETWLKDLCIAWGWRLDTIDLRPELLRFTISLSPDIAPAQAVQHLAHHLSTRILQAFPGFNEDLPSGQFWTKSYLLTAGSDVGKDRLSLFIETTRKEQGLVN